MNLADLQGILYRLITAPSGVEEGLARERSLGSGGLEGLIAGDDRLSARERVEIYANAYFYRLLEVLKEDFPALLAVLGASDFHNLITGYLVDYPPTEPSVFFAGRHLPEFVKNHPFSQHRPYLADLALIERTSLEIFHAADATPIEPSVLSAIAPADWPELEFAMHPASRITRLGWHVERLTRAVENGEAWEMPAAGPLALLTWRRNDVVYYRELEPGEAAGLGAAREGATFAGMCEAIADVDGGADLAPVISRFLSGWINAGVLIRRPR